jgi:Ca2+-binding EF-hand superfamily protein
LEAKDLYIYFQSIGIYFDMDQINTFVKHISFDGNEEIDFTEYLSFLIK